MNDLKIAIQCENTGFEKDVFYNEGTGDLTFQGEKQVRINPFTLIFSDQEEEREFREKLHAKSKK